MRRGPSQVRRASHEDAVGFAGLVELILAATVGGGRIDEESTCQERIDQLTGGHGERETTIGEGFLLGAGDEGHQGHETYYNLFHNVYVLINRWFYVV